MPVVTSHFLQAGGGWEGRCDAIEARVQATYLHASTRMALPALDVIVKQGARLCDVLTVLGHAPAPRIIWLTIDLVHLSATASSTADLERMFLHELHHAARWEGPGYGRSLGEALVSEGLACHFVRETCRIEGEPWEHLSDDVLAPYWREANGAWGMTAYRHDAWFTATATCRAGSVTRSARALSGATSPTTQATAPRRWRMRTLGCFAVTAAPTDSRSRRC